MEEAMSLAHKLLQNHFIIIITITTLIVKLIHLEIAIFKPLHLYKPTLKCKASILITKGKA
jgi:hypothetical protein